jgi:hypothetical protein
MPTLDINGTKVNVDDSFLKLPSDKQQIEVEEIASQLGLKPSGGDAKGGGVLRAASGVAKQAATGVAKGVADLEGLPGDVAGYAGAGADWLASKAGLPPVSGTLSHPLSSLAHALGAGEAYDANQITNLLPQKAKEVLNPLRGSEASNRIVQSVTGPYREPQNVAEEFADTAGRFVPAAMMGGPGGVVRKALLYGVLPGLASEAAGQAFKGGPLETPARIAAGVAAGGGAAMAQRMGSAERLVANATQGARPEQIDQAEALFNQAQQAGIPISRAEALQAVTNGATKLGDLQHTVEGMGGMKDFYAQRPAQNEAAARRSFDTIAPRNADPSQIGPAAGQAAEGVVTNIRQAINEYTRPMYEAGGRHLVPERVHAAFMQDPLFAQTAQTIRNDPALNAVVQNVSDRSVRFYDEVAKQLEQRGRNASQPLNPQHNQTVAAVTGNMGGDVKDVAMASERAATGGPSSYQAALANQARLRQQYLQPVLNGPIGKIAGQDTTTKAAIDALFPTNPLANSQDEVAETVRALSRQRPGIANDLVRTHAEMTFNEAAQRLASGGENQSGGAKFAAVLRGNPQQSRNLEAAVRALPNGDGIWTGFNRLLDVMEAQQYRQATGSRTAFKVPGVEDLRSGGAANNIVQVVAGGGVKLPQKVMTAIQNWNVGRNIDQLADLLTSPEAAQRFRQLATLPPDSLQFAALVGRLATMANEGARGKRTTAAGNE